MEKDNVRYIAEIVELQEQIDKLVIRATERAKAKEIADEAKKLAEKIKDVALEAKELADNIADTARNPLVILDGDLRIISVNKAFYNTFKVKSNETIGSLIYDVGNKQWNMPKLRKLLEDILPKSATIENYEIEHDFQSIGRRVMVLNARRIIRSSGKTQMVFLAIEDITDAKKTIDLLKAFNKVAVGRELRMHELKGEVDALLQRLDEKSRYNSV